MSKYLAFLEMRYIQYYDTDEERRNLIDSYKEEGDNITIVDSKEGETGKEFIDRIMGLTNSKYIIEDAYNNAIYLYRYLEEILEEGLPLTGIININYLGEGETEEYYNRFKEIISVKEDIDNFLKTKKGCFKFRLSELEKDITSCHEELLKAKGQDELNEVTNNLKICLRQKELNKKLLEELEHITKEEI